MTADPTPVDPPRRDERWHWRAALVAPAVLAPAWVAAGRALGVPPPLGTAAGATVALLLLTVVWTDLTARRIPNWTTYTAALWAAVLVALAAVLGDPPGGTGAEPVFGSPPWDDALGGFIGGFVAMLFLFSVFGGGGGDVKLVAALGGLLGLRVVVMVLFYGYIVAGAVAVAFVIWRVGPVDLFRSAAGRLFPGLRPPGVSVLQTLKLHVPMAPFLAAGVVLAVLLRE